MIPIKSPSYAHRIYDAASATNIPAIGASTPKWKKSSGQPASVKACTIPGFGDATAKWLANDAIADPTLVDSTAVLHLTPEGNRIEFELPVRYPRYVYVIGGQQLYTGSSGSGLNPALMAAYADLAAIGGRLIFSDGGTTDIAVNQTHALIVPIAGGTSTPTGLFNLPDNRITDEADPYDAGELFIAVVQGSRSGSTWYNANQVTGTQANYANATAENTGTPVTYPGYTAIESLVSGSQTIKLVVNAKLAEYDANLAAMHAQNYLKFQQKYYFPSGPLQSFNDVPNFTTSYSALFAAVNPTGFPSAVYPFMDATTLALQIIADAVAFFTS